METAGKINQLKIESVKDTLALVDHDSLQKARHILATHRTINLFSLANITFIAEEFVYKMRHIGNPVIIYPKATKLNNHTPIYLP